MSEILIPKKISILELLDPDEGEINQYYGRIGSGKTYTATSDVLRDLKRGQVVYANWKLNFKGYDERNIWYYKILGVLGLKRKFINIPKENFHYLPIGSDIVHKLSTLNDCIIYLDEGHLYLDSYITTKMDISERASILHTRHFNRVINVISQRAMAIHVTVRANVNRFYRCESVFQFMNFHVFRKTEFQDLTFGETVDEELPVSQKLYFGRKEIFEMYDTKYLRGDTPPSQTNYGEVFIPTWNEKLKSFFSLTRKNS